MTVLRDDLLRGPKPDRVLVSYPKCGRTWVGVALDAGGVVVTMTHAGASTNRREIGRTPQAPDPRLAGCRVAFLWRDPVDVAVSMFHQVTRRDLVRGSARWWRLWPRLALAGAMPPADIDGFVLHPAHGVARVAAFTRGWLDHLAGRPEAMVVTYEGLRADPVAGFARLAAFFGAPQADGAAMAAAADFGRMQAAEIARAGVADPARLKSRRGKVGGAADELRPETLAAARAVAARYGF